MSKQEELPLDIERYYSTDTVARLFDVKPYTVREWIRDGQIHAVQINRYWRIPESEVRRLAGVRLGVEVDAGMGGHRDDRTQ